MHGGEGLLDAHGLGVAQHLQGRLDRQGRGRDDLLGQRARRRHQLGQGHHGVEQTPAQRLLGRHAPPGQQHLHGHRARQPAPQADDAAAAGEDAQLGLGQEHLDVLGGHDQVAGERDLEAAADRGPVERGDHRLVEIEDLGQAGEAAGAVIGVEPLRALGRGLEVHIFIVKIRDMRGRTCLILAV